MPLQYTARYSRNRYVVSFTLGYAVFALLWIFLSDQLLAAFTNIEEIVWLSQAKGMAFVMITALLFYFALRFVPARETGHFSLDDFIVEYPASLRWPRWLNYAFAVAITLVILWVRQTLPVPSTVRPLMTLFMLPIVLSAALGGLGPGLVATMTGALCALYFIIPPVNAMSAAASYDLFQLGFLVANGVLVSILSETLHRALRRVETSRQLQTITLSCAGDAIITTARSAFSTQPQNA